jgi:heptosyltransferase-3
VTGRFLSATNCNCSEPYFERDAQEPHLILKKGSTTNRALDRYIGIPVLYTTALFKARLQRPPHFQRIGILASPTMGDTLLSSAAVLDIRHNHPDAEILYFAFEENLAAAKLLPAVDEIVCVRVGNILHTLRSMRNRKLDILFDLTPWQRLTAFYTAMSGAAARIGFRSPRQYRHWHYDIAAEHSRAVHELENYRSLLRAAGLRTSKEPALRLPDSPTLPLGHDRQLVVFHPWANGDHAALREWPDDRWVALATGLKGANTRFLITGAPSERSRSEQLAQRLAAAGVRAEPFVSADGLAGVARLLAGCALVVSINTGIMHLAAIVGAPTIALNGPTATHRWGPIGPRVLAVEPHEGARGFLNFGFEFAGNPADCMHQIRVEDVIQAVHKVAPRLVPSAATSIAATACQA